MHAVASLEIFMCLNLCILKLPAGWDPRTLTCKKERRTLNTDFHVCVGVFAVISAQVGALSGRKFWKFLPLELPSEWLEGLMVWFPSASATEVTINRLRNAGDGLQGCLVRLIEALNGERQRAAGVRGATCARRSFASVGLGQWEFNPLTPCLQARAPRSQSCALSSPGARSWKSPASPCAGASTSH